MPQHGARGDRPRSSLHLWVPVERWRRRAPGPGRTCRAISGGYSLLEAATISVAVEVDQASLKRSGVPVIHAINSCQLPCCFLPRDE